MPIKVRATPGQQVCPFCRDAAGPTSPACSACATRYHEECAQTLGTCALLGCVGVFPVEVAARALPRLALMARRLGAPVAWEPDADEGPWVTYFLPASRAVATRDATLRVVGDVLGQTAYDARLRLQAPHPELLARAGTAQEAARICQSLAGVGVEVFALRLADLVRPLARFDVTGFAAGDPVVCRDAQGRRRLYGRDDERLLVEGHLVEVNTHKTTYQRSGGSTRGDLYGGARNVVRTRQDRLRSLVVHAFTPDDPVPARLFGRDLRELDGVERGVSARETLDRVLARFRGGGTRVEPLADMSSPTLLHRYPGQRQADNGAALLLASRLVYHAWMARREAAAGKSKGT